MHCRHLVVLFVTTCVLHVFGIAVDVVVVTGGVVGIIVFAACDVVRVVAIIAVVV